MPKDAAVARVEGDHRPEAEIGKIYNGKVARIENYGAFVNILPGKDGLLHISEIARERVEKVRDYLGGRSGRGRGRARTSTSDGRIRLSMKELPNYAA